MKKILKKDRIDYTIIMMIFVIINLVVVSKVKTISIIPDEINTLAIPAALSGNYWKLVNGYYGWGGSIFYYPLFLLIKNPIVLYRNIIMLNSILLSAIPCIAYMMSKKFFRINNRKLRLLLALFIGVYPGTFAMSQYGWNETWIRVIIWVVLFFLFKLINENKGKKLNSFILGGLLAYSYTIHGRLLVLIPIVIIIYIYILKIYNIKFINITHLIYGYFPIFFFDIIVKKQIKKIFFDNSSLRNTFSDTLINSLKVLKNFKLFMTIILRATTSYTFYVGITSFGIVFLGIVLLIKLLKTYKNQDKEYILLGMFSVIGILFSVIISVIFFIPDFYEHKVYIWGRYADYFTPVVIFFVILLAINKKIDLKDIYYTITIILILSFPVLLVETINVYSGMADINIISLISFVPGYTFDSPEKFYLVILFLMIISGYVLFMLKKNIYITLIIGLGIYSTSNVHLEYMRIKKSEGTFSIIKNEYEILRLIKKNSKNKIVLNFINDVEKDVHPISYLLLLNGFNINYGNNLLEKNIKLNEENISLVKSNKESLMLDKNIYKVNLQSSEKHDYSLYYKKNNEIKKILDSENIVSEKYDTYNINLASLYTTNGNIIKGNDLIISPNNVMYGPYIELRPNLYKVIITGKGLNKKEVLFSFHKSDKKNTIISEKYLTTIKEYNKFVGEFTLDDFTKGFETIIENKSKNDVAITSIKIIAK